MLWLILDITLPLAAVVVMGAGVLRLWRRTKALTKRVGAANEAVAVANDSLAAAQAASPRRR